MRMLPALEELRVAASVCTACPLSERRTNVVFGKGDPASPLVLVGEGPGADEDRTGIPFVGRAGQLLDKAIAEAGLATEAVYICNTVKCRACDWRDGKAYNRPPSDEETQACRQWLLPQLSLIAPTMVLCIGAPSAKNLIRGNFKITKERGVVFPSAYARATMATLHPAYILRQSSATHDGGFSLLVDDIAKAWRLACELRAAGKTTPKLSLPEVEA